MPLPFSSIKDPRYVTPNKTAIAVTVIIEGKESLGEQAFIATPHDTEVYGRSLFNQCLKGNYGKIADYVEPPPMRRPVMQG